MNDEYFVQFVAGNQDAGKYMVRAVNAGGEAQSIADFIVLEPTPERMIEIVKTVKIENVDGQTVRGTDTKINSPFFFIFYYRVKRFIFIILSSVKCMIHPIHINPHFPHFTRKTIKKFEHFSFPISSILFFFLVRFNE